MKPLDLESIFAAAIIGAVALSIINNLGDKIIEDNSKAVGYGALIGALVQIGVRTVGVS